MRFDEFEKDARKQLAERREISEEQLDEILPAIGAIGAGLARVAGTAAVRGGAALARGVGRAAGAAARGVGRAAGAAARGVGRAAAGAARGTAKGVGRAAARAVGGNNPNATVGSQGTQGTTGTQQSQPTKKIRPGQTIDLPSQNAGGRSGPTKKFKVTRTARGEVELQNPQPKPGEPKKFTYNQDELQGVLDANQ